MNIFFKQYVHLLRRKYGKPKIVVWVPLLAFAFYSEWFCYFLLTYQWPSLNCGFVNEVHKVLFVADPQILGEYSESAIARIDCDLFLKSTFNHALNHVKPDLIIFLGDLMDEGSIASREQYERYYKRFRNIFQLDFIPENNTIFLPGDNDIGGEDDEVTEYKVRRFNKYFKSDDIILHKNVKFFKVNGMTRTFPDVNVKNDSSLRILISHMPLLGVYSTFGEQAISQLKPLFIFSAHDHKSVHLVTGKDTPVRELVEALEVKPSAWMFNLLNNRRVNEIVVPTASYRMGTPYFGFGVALLSTKGDALCYYTLWSPCRLYHLLFYIILIPVTIVAFIIISIMNFFKRRRRRDIYKQVKLSV